ncbi:MAG TPA: transcriptional regulator [Gallionella sp.]|jgi:predicted ArsR family transcriptional regulator|nr:MAG: transcriptional regulator [Gallionellales bacterium GWA2_54_124]OGT18218.1 MAG: transcriptional regulator [Gallionellales bacterium RIFOXYD12_FULL_53_10]OGT22652.1 MAG: transcriptional regulator [Gallionellales bacterium RIFOXYD2_FULL_52_7]HCI53318.1 transcriptional regulator [Gallionella sp.]
MPTNQILLHLKKHGEKLDTEIADAIGIPLATAQIHLAELTAKGKVMSCHVTRFIEGKKIEGVVCRLAGYTPPTAPGRKST